MNTHSSARPRVRRKITTTTLIAASLTFGAVSLPVSAQTERSRSMIEEIVVTAQKREESIQDVGMSIQAANG